MFTLDDHTAFCTCLCLAVLELRRKHAGGLNKVDSRCKSRYCQRKSKDDRKHSAGLCQVDHDHAHDGVPQTPLELRSVDHSVVASQNHDEW